MDDSVIAAIRNRLRAKLSDLGSAQHSRLKPISPTDISQDEKRLGFSLPPLMKRIYADIGNGGFGPGYGLIGLTNGVPDDTGKTAPEIYAQFRSLDSSEPNWKWPPGLLPVCHWGCAILSCVDCADANFRMRIFDPNAHERGDWADSFFEESASFEKWIADWVAGVNLWDLMYGEKGHISQILTARRSH